MAADEVKWRGTAGEGSAWLPICLFALSAPGCGSRTGLRDDAFSAGLDSGPNSNGDASWVSTPWIDAGLSASADASAKDATWGDDAGGGSSGDGTGPEPTIASTYLVNPAHTSQVDDRALVPPLKRLWVLNDGHSSSYPLIANGLVYVITGMTPGLGLTAFDGRTGATVWGPVDLLGTSNVFGASHAYEGGRIFTTNGSGEVRAFDALVGAPLWTIQLPSEPDGEEEFGLPPTAYRGILYTASSDYLYALEETTGAQIWRRPLAGGLASPGVNDNGAFIVQACPQAWRFDRVTGSVFWSHLTQGCEGGGGEDVAVYAGRLYDLGDRIILDEATGATEGEFPYLATPAFHSGRMFVSAGKGLEAFDSTSGAIAWSFDTIGKDLTTPPLVAGGNVYFILNNQTTVAVNELTGQEVWSDTILTAAAGDLVTPIALAAAEGILVVPWASGVIVYGSDTQDAGAVR